LFRVETAGYDYHPLLLQPLTDGYKITGKIPEGTLYRHHLLSALLIYPLLGEELIIKLGPALLAEIVEALALAHVTGTTSSNPMLLALRDADRVATAASLDAMVTSASVTAPVAAPVPSIAPAPRPASPQGPTTSPASRQAASPDDPDIEDHAIILPSPQHPPVTQNLLEVYLDCLRHKIAREWQENFCFYVFPQSNILCIVNPRFTLDLFALMTRRIGRDVPEAVVMELLDKAGLVALKADGGRKHFITMDIQLSGAPGVRHLNCLCLRLSRIFPSGTRPTFKGGAYALSVMGSPVSESPVVSEPKTPMTYVLSPNA
jgi:hypothetical protein